MTTAKQTAFRFTPADLALLEALQRKLGIVNRTEIIRLALRRLADLEGVATALDAPRKSKVGSTGRRA
jgi:hypothetical protein